MRRLSVALLAFALAACVPDIPELPSELPEVSEPVLEEPLLNEPLLNDAPVNADHPDVFATLRIMDGDTAVREVGNFYADPDETYFFLELPAATEVAGFQGGAPKVSETKWITIGTEDEALDLFGYDTDLSLLEGKMLHLFLNPDRIFYPGDPSWPGHSPRIDEITGYTFAG